MTDGTLRKGVTGRDGGGEDAKATPGAGGAGALFFPDGPHGHGFAQGGADAQGSLPAADSRDALSPAVSKGN